MAENVFPVGAFQAGCQILASGTRIVTRSAAPLVRTNGSEALAITLIRTSRGDVAVEALQVGDLAVTASGALRPITWIGHRDSVNGWR